MRLVRDFVEVSDRLPLDEVIRQLSAARDLLPAGAVEAEVRMSGDDVFGRRLMISFLRPQTPEEIARDARYADAHCESRLRQLARLQAEIEAEGETSHLSIAA
jgi:hypothetical protein